MRPVIDDGVGWSAWPAPAKLNLFLQITGRRADGYHELQTVFRLLDWGDTIHLRVREDGRIHRIGVSVIGVVEADDLMVRAAYLLRNATNVHFGADIFVEKRIPVCGGFGGGSSDAATVLLALNALWQTGLDVAALAALGLRLGADVPVFVHGCNAWGEGVGECLTPMVLPGATYLLFDPGVYMPTQELFLDPHLTRDASPATIGDFVSGTLFGNAFEPVLRRREPAVAAALDVLSEVGLARVTGSGSGCFVEFSTRDEAECALERLPYGLCAWVAGGASRSPLLDVLETMEC